MSRQVTPTYNRIPLPIAPNVADWPLPEHLRSRHHTMHPSIDWRLLPPKQAATYGVPPIRQLGGWAVRTGSIHIVDQRMHNVGPAKYHRFFGGSELPQTEHEQFYCHMFQRVGLIPPEGIELKRQGARRIRLSPEQRAILQTPSESSPFGYKYFRHGPQQSLEFIGAYVLGQSLDHLPEYDIEEFLDARVNRPRHRKVGHSLLMRQVEVAVEVSGFGPAFDNARRQGLIDPRISALGITSETFIKDYLLQSSAYQETVLMPRLEVGLSLVRHAA